MYVRRYNSKAPVYPSRMAGVARTDALKPGSAEQLESDRTGGRPLRLSRARAVVIIICAEVNSVCVQRNQVQISF